jgi:hypothetical protein
MWVIEFEFSGNEINHIDKISSIPVSSCPSFSELNFGITIGFIYLVSIFNASVVI